MGGGQLYSFSVVDAAIKVKIISLPGSKSPVILGIDNESRSNWGNLDDYYATDRSTSLKTLEHCVRCPLVCRPVSDLLFVKTFLRGDSNCRMTFSAVIRVEKEGGHRGPGNRKEKGGLSEPIVDLEDSLLCLVWLNVALTDPNCNP